MSISSFLSKIIGSFNKYREFEFKESEGKRRYNLEYLKHEFIVNAYKTLQILSDKVVHEKNKDQDKINDIQHERIDDLQKHHSEVTELYKKYQDTQHIHHSEVTELYKNGIKFSLNLLALIFEQKDGLLKNTLSTIEQVSKNNEDNFDNFNNYTQEIELLNNGLKSLAENCHALKEDLLELEGKLNRLRIDFTNEEAVYKKIKNLREQGFLSDEAYDKELFKSLTDSLKIARDINLCEISLIEKKYDKNCIEEKYLFVKYVYETLEHKKYQELYAFKNSFNAVKIFAQAALSHQKSISDKQSISPLKEINEKNNQ